MIRLPARQLSAWLLIALLPLTSRAGLLAEHTRIIYPAAHNARSVLIANTNPWPVLVQTWVDRGEGDLERATAPFVVVPAIFRLEPAATQTLRILYTGEALPDDRESMFWLNLYEIPPSAPAEDADTPLLTLTLTTQIKLFYRPEGIGTPAALAERLAFGLQQDGERWCVAASNPTPWHAAFSALSIDGSEGELPVVALDTLPPFASGTWCLDPGQPAPAANIHFSLIDDAGFSQSHQRRLTD